MRMKRLLLLGGGHAHVQVLQAFARQRPAGVELLLVTPFARQMYSGMVPGLVAGHYRAEQCAIALAPLAAAAGAGFVEGSAVALDAAARRVTLGDGRVAEYDWLSIDTGAEMARDRLPGAAEHALFVRPIEHFVVQLDALVERALACAPGRSMDLCVIGAGAAGVELALALQHRLGQGGVERARIALVTGGPPPLAGYPAAVQRRIARVLAARRISVLPDGCAALRPGQLLLQGGARVACDVPLLATGAEAPAWPKGSGLALDERGFIRTGATLQSVSHPEVFAAGDVASRDDVSHPKSGVYAVRAGPPLAENLRRAAAGEPLQPHRPQQRTLNLVSLGRREAIASWGGWSAQGRWVWWWKDRIDRAFVKKYSPQAR